MGIYHEITQKTNEKTEYKEIKITKTEAKELSSRFMKEMDDFYNDHFLKPNNNGDLLTTIKHHLYIESLLDRIFAAILPKDGGVKEFSFSQKIVILESIDLNHTGECIIVLKTINKLRNKFAHDINYQIQKDDIEKASSILKIDSSLPLGLQLRMIFRHTVGYLHGIISICELFPLGMILLHFLKKIEKDKCYSDGMIKKMYPWDAMKEIMEALKI